jgi:hypothetical protein
MTVQAQRGNGHSVQASNSRVEATAPNDCDSSCHNPNFWGAHRRPREGEKGEKGNCNILHFVTLKNDENFFFFFSWVAGEEVA